jgi:predicted RNA-binding Zn ribbon-like protein
MQQLSPDPHDHAPHELGGRLCVAFANSVEWRRSATPRELMPDASAMVEWTRELGLIDPDEAEVLMGSSDTSPAVAGYGRAIDLRETLYRLLGDAAAGREPAADDVEALNDSLADAHGAIKVIHGPAGYASVWSLEGHEFDLARLAAARSTASLLCSDDLARLKQCPGPECGWLFVDSSRNRSRRWCDTRLCGNRDRVARHYARNRPEVFRDATDYDAPS